jgi:DnaJ homolog subfamily A member 5
MRCHYEVLEVERTATIDEIKKQYKKLALRHHPDRNLGNEEAATEAFKLVTSAYTVLSDPQERQWYDDHREAILRGGNGTRTGDEDEEYTYNIWPFFNSSCYNGFEDTNDGFYAVYAALFHRLWQDERDSDGKYELDEPVFGRSDSSASEIMRFYNYWTYFTTSRSFSWEDKYNINDGPNRYVRR